MGWASFNSSEWLGRAPQWIFSDTQPKDNAAPLRRISVRARCAVEQSRYDTLTDEVGRRKRFVVRRIDVESTEAAAKTASWSGVENFFKTA
jgi:hypothetical protein